MTWRRCAENPRSGARHGLDDDGESQEEHTQAQQSARGGRSATRPQHPRTRPAAAGPGARRRAARDPAPRLRPVSPRALGEGLMHSCAPDQPCWKLVPLVLALAFAARAAVALTGDFVLHPDEIMQYLEPAHRLAFGIRA